MIFSLFSRHLVSTTLIIIAFVLPLSLLSSFLVKRLHRTSPHAPPPVLYAKILSHLDPADRIEALKGMGAQDANSVDVLWVLNDKGAVLYPPKTKRLPFKLDPSDLPRRPLEFAEFSRSHDDGPGAPPSAVAVKLDSEPSQYLVVTHNDFGPGFLAAHPFVMTFVTLIIAVIMGTSVSTFMLYYNLRKKAVLADSVLTELQNGNLKARFPVSKMDEVGEAMVRFNKMAEEIERLVDRLRSTEQSRMALLQELAHDLRTPIASLKAMLETLSSRFESLSPEIRAEFMAQSQKEVEYFANLVEDLLFLAQAGEPKYVHSPHRVKLNDLVEDEINSTEKFGETARVAIECTSALDNDEVKGDPHLLRRLIRNALDNAVGHAKAQVKVMLRRANEKFIEIAVQDDGQGFSEQALREFGRRRPTRTYSSGVSRRAAVGLGSVIMNTIVELHRGQLRALNLLDASHRVSGGEVIIRLPVV